MIELKNIQVEFSRDGASATAAVDDVSLTILEGEVFGIIGSSGAGKSTLVRTINLLQKPTSGDIVIDGASIVGQTGARLRETRCGIGMIFQHFNLWNAKTVYDNVAFPLKCARWSKQDIEERVVELLEFVNLEEKRDAYPQTLSGGQKQRVAIARALAANTRILLCDEPTSALDLETTKSVLDVLKRVNQQLGVTIVVITHELDVVKGICDRIAVMDGGRVVEQGETYEVFSNPQSEMLRGLVRHLSLIHIYGIRARRAFPTLPRRGGRRVLRMRAAQRDLQHDGQRVDGREREQRQQRQPVIGAERAQNAAYGQADHQEQTLSLIHI